MSSLHQRHTGKLVDLSTKQDQLRFCAVARSRAGNHSKSVSHGLRGAELSSARVDCGDTSTNVTAREFSPVSVLDFVFLGRSHCFANDSTSACLSDPACFRPAIRARCPRSPPIL